MGEWTKERHEAAAHDHARNSRAYAEGATPGAVWVERIGDMLAKNEALAAALDRARALAKRARELSPYRHPCDIAEQDEAIESLCEVLGEPRPVALVGRMTPERLSEIREQFDNEGSVGARQEGEMLTEIERVRFLRRPAA